MYIMFAQKKQKPKSIWLHFNAINSFFINNITALFNYDMGIRFKLNAIVLGNNNMIDRLFCRVVH